MWRASGAARNRGPPCRTILALITTRRDAGERPVASAAPRPRPSVPVPPPRRPGRRANPARAAARLTWPARPSGRTFPAPRLRPFPGRTRISSSRVTIVAPAPWPAPDLLESLANCARATAGPGSRRRKFASLHNPLRASKRRRFYLAIPQTFSPGPPTARSPRRCSRRKHATEGATDSSFQNDRSTHEYGFPAILEPLQSGLRLRFGRRRFAGLAWICALIFERSDEQFAAPPGLRIG